MNVDVYNGLPAEDQEVILNAARESAVLQRELWAERSAASQEMIIASGVEFNEISEENKAAFQEAMAPVYESLLADNPELADLIDLIINTE